MATIDLVKSSHRRLESAGVHTVTRILVKDAPGLTTSQLQFGAASVHFTVPPLFKSIGPQPALGAVAQNVWQILTPPPGFAGDNSWDICHSLLQQGFGVAGTSPPE